MLANVGAVHEQGLLIKKHHEEASRDYSLTLGPEFSLALSRFTGQVDRFLRRAGNLHEGLVEIVEALQSLHFLT